jgi:hypothetical protein
LATTANTATTNVVIDRTKFDIKYGSEVSLALVTKQSMMILL